MAGNVPAAGETNLAKIVQAIRELFEGRSNAVGSFSLDQSPATTTTVTVPTCGASSTVLIAPKNADGKSAYFAGAYVSSIVNGSFVVTHGGVFTDCQFRYAVLG